MEAVVALDGVAVEEVEVDLDGLCVRLLRAGELARHVDADALLRADEPPEPPYWMHLWPGALAAARCLVRAAEVRPAARVLELGCGLALPALVAAQRGARVLASDRAGAPLRFARRSAARNGAALELVQMDWAAPALRGRFDVCVGADVAYDRAAEAGLVAALTQVVAPGGVVWLADSVNTGRRGVADGLRAADFTLQETMVSEMEEGRTVWVRLIEARR